MDDPTSRIQIDHATLVRLRKEGKAQLGIESSVAVKLVDHLPTRYRAAVDFWFWVWFLMFPGALVAGFYYSWWAALGLLLMAGPVRHAVKRSAAEFVLEFATENEDFFNACVERGYLTIRVRQ
jgi:hypothetical protein